MKLIDNWKTVALKAHSMWALYLSALFLIAPEVIYLLLEIDTNPRLWWIGGFVLLIYGIIGRMKDQGIDRTTMRSPIYVGLIALAVVGAIAFSGQSLIPQRSAGGASADAPVAVPSQANTVEQRFLALAVPFVGKWEGLRLTAYLDVIGVWTVCYGETKGVRPGDSYTRAECDRMFAKELLGYRAGLHRYLTPETLRSRLPPRRDVAFVSFAYNVGVAGAGKSTAVKRLNAGRISGACEALTWWNKAGGRVIRGLVNRRSEERD